MLDCPACGDPLIPAHLVDEDGEGLWNENDPPTACPCGALVRVTVCPEEGAVAVEADP